MIKSPVRAIVAAVDAAAARWRDPAFEPRTRAREAVMLRTAYSRPVVEYAFDRLFGPLNRGAIEAIVEDELGCLDALDAFVERRGRPRAAAAPLGRVCIVSSRTTIGVAIVPAVFALCAKCDVLVKDREDHLVAAFFETLAHELEDLRGAAVARTWAGDADAETLRGFDAVVAFGNDATLLEISAVVRYPARMIGFGTKASAGYVTRDALHDEASARAIAAGAARDLVLYESEGCLSLHALFVENGGAIGAERFGEILADALRDAAAEFPPPLDAALPARRAAARDLAAFRGERYFTDARAGYLAVLDPPAGAPPFFIPRALAIHRVDRPAGVAEYFERHGIAVEALALAGRRDDLLELVTRLKVARVAPFGTLQAPPLGTFHGGRPRIAEFVRWIGDEG